MPTLSSPTHHLLTSATTLTQLKQIHAQILLTGQSIPTPFLHKLISSPNLNYALSVFNQIPSLPINLCNKLLRELSKSNEPKNTLLLYAKMRREDGVDRFSFPPILKASAKCRDVKVGMEIHGVGLRMGFVNDGYVQTGLLGVYVACGRVLDARLLFDEMSERDVVCWSVMIDGYCQSGLYEDALLLFKEMKCSNAKPDRILLSTVVSACNRLGDLKSGKEVHDYILDMNIVMDAHLQSSLIIMYANCGSMELAQRLYDNMMRKDLIASTAMVVGYSKLKKIGAARSIFDGMIEKDLVCWSAMISGYAESDWPLEALKLFNDMQLLGLKPDRITMLCIISACAQLGALHKAKWVHDLVDNNGFGDILSINNALVDMYAKCGNLEYARKVFDKVPQTQRNVITWTSMITGFAMHGDAKTVLELFEQMKADGVEPNSVTFVSVLYACSHAGFVNEGRHIFASMTNEYKIEHKHEHYGCMVDLLGRANLLNDALDLINSMPFSPNIVVWGSLLSACRVHGNVEMGELAAKQLLEIDPEHDGTHVLLSNIYAKARRWEDVRDVRNSMKDGWIAKERGHSRIEINNEIHEFLTCDKTHKQVDEIYRKLDEVVSKLKLVGYAPDAGSVLVDLGEQEKKEVVLWHSEKLALCYGLTNSKKGDCIRIIKNLRVCEDCHTFFKFVSQVFDREIVVRDRTRFHHYRNGACSCNDYWYGTIWIATTLIFVIAALGNCATYLIRHQSDKTTPWIFDVSYLNVAAGGIYGYTLIAPAAYHFLLQYLGLNTSSLVRFWCMWGYSLFIFIPTSLLMVIPLEFIRWVVIIASGSASAAFVALNLKSEIQANDLNVVLVSAFVLQLALALFIKIWFFP